MEITSEVKRLIDTWQNNKRLLKDARNTVTVRENEFIRSEADLGRFLLPDDAKKKEKFCVWYGDSLLCVELKESGTPKLTIRNHGKSLE